MTSTMRFDRWENTLGNTAVTMDQISGGSGLVPVIPASVGAISSGTATVNSAGLVTFTGVNGFQLNSVFTSAFTNYRLVCNINVTSGTGGDLTVRLRNNGTDYTTTNYFTAGRWISSTATEATYVANAANTGYLGNVYSSADPYTQFMIDIHNPQKPIMTNLRTSFSAVSPGSQFAQYLSSVLYNVNTAADGLSIWGWSGTVLTGTVQVYGYR